MLMEAGARVDGFDSDFTPLGPACDELNYEAAGSILGHGADVHRLAWRSSTLDLAHGSDAETLQAR